MIKKQKNSQEKGEYKNVVNEEVMLLLKGLSQQLIVINSIMLMLCKQTNKGINEEVKNKVRETIN